MNQINCEFCHFQLQEIWYFCPNCGKKIKQEPPSIKIISQIGLYALSFFLPPLGLWPAVKYLKWKDKKVKTVGVVAIILTVISLIFSFYLAFQLGLSINKQINEAYSKYQYMSF